MSTVRANDTVAVMLFGRPHSVRKWDEYNSDDAIVKEYPWLFVDPVERATAAPGERRNVRLPKTK